MRRSIALALALLVPLLMVGCGDSSTSAEPAPPPAPPSSPSPSPPPPSPPPAPSKTSPTFTKDDLPRIALGPKNAPSGLRYLKEESGPTTLAGIGLILPRQTRPLRALGFKAVHDSVFVAKAQSDQRVSQRLWLFRNRRGASAWLKKTRDDSVALQWAPIGAPQLGDESWAARGLIQIGGGEAMTHAFRLGNAVFTVSMYGNVTPPTEAGALAAAKAALAKASRG